MIWMLFSAGSYAIMRPNRVQESPLYKGLRAVSAQLSRLETPIAKTAQPEVKGP